MTNNGMPKSLIGKLLFYLLVAVILVIVLFPVLWMVLASLKTKAEMLDLSHMFSFHPTLKNFKAVFVDNNILLPLKNSLIVSTTAVAISLVLGLPASYSIARNNMHRFSNIILVIRIIPTVTFLVPWYILFSKLGLTGTYSSLIICHVIISLPLIVWIMIPYFKMLPIDVEQSAYIDGCTRFGAFIRIMLPLASPGILTSGILAFIFSWNNFLFALVLCNSKTNTLPVSIYQFITYTNIDWGGIMAAAVVITAPVIIIAFFLQKYIITGLTAGAVKE